MVRMRAALLPTAVFLVLGGCDLGVRTDASQDVARFLAAARAGDKAAFEAAVDRPALREDLRDQLIDVARAQELEIEGGPSEFALDRMISPPAFRLVQAETGEPMGQAPTAAQVAMMLKVVDRRHVCLRDARAEDRCVLTFAKEKDAWRLVGMQATDLQIAVAKGD